MSDAAYVVQKVEWYQLRAAGRHGVLRDGVDVCRTGS